MSIKSEAGSLSIVDEKLRVNWAIYPFLFEVNDLKKKRLDWENVESRWVNPDEIRRFETGPFLYETLEKVLRFG